MANEEQLVFDGLTLNDTTFGLRELSCPPPRQKPEWIGAADSEWQSLVRDPMYENRQITAVLNIAPQASMNAALDKIGLVRDKCRLASRTPDGIDLVWTPASSTRSVTFEVLAAEITDMPIDNENGWMLALAPTITLQMTAKPYWLGVRTVTSTASSSTPFVTMEITGVTGDAPALGELFVIDTASQSRRHVEWGLEGQYYNASTLLLIDSDDMVTSGFAGAQATTTGAYDPNATSNNSVSVSVTTNTTAAAGTGNLLHVGTFRVKGRVQSPDTTVQVRLAWQTADGPWTSNDWASVNLSGTTWQEVDLGSITVPPVISGTQRWTGRIEARTTTGTSTLVVDYLELIPAAEGYGKARATPSSAAPILVGYDQFTGTTSGSALNARVAPAGGTWATSGDATDFAFADLPLATDETVTRSAVSGTNGRFAILGTTNYTDTQVDASTYRTFNSGVLAANKEANLGVIARWTDASNHVRAMQSVEVDAQPAAHRKLKVVQLVAGTPSTLASVEIPGSISGLNQWLVVRFLVYASGQFVCRLLDSTKTAVLLEISGSSTALATGGTLATGKVGLFDNYTHTSGTAVRYYDDFSVSTPPPEPIVLYSGRNMQIRHDTAFRQDSTGTYTGDLPSYRGSRFLVPVGTSRVIVKARRNDVDTAADANVTDATQIQVAWTQRGLVVPR